MSDRERSFSFSGGFAEGVKSFFQSKLPKAPIFPPDQPVRDIATLSTQESPPKLHRRASEFSETHLPTQQREQIRDAHKFGAGFVTGMLLPTAAMFLAARRGKVAFPQHARKITAFQAVNLAVGASNMVSMPSMLNRKVEARAPEAHAVGTAALHTEAEKVRKNSTSG
jgi:hypothetical protein